MTDDPMHPITDERSREVYEWMTSLGCVPKGARYETCRHGHVCLNAGHLLHPLTLDVRNLGAEEIMP